MIAVQAAVNDARCLWRELERHDVGVDGHIEYATPDGLVTGRLIGVQIKSGSSYFGNTTGDAVSFYPEEKHRRYWADYPLPVILILHDPSTGESIWIDARQELRTTDAILVPRANLFDASGVLEALQSAGPLPVGSFEPTSTAGRMAAPTGPQGLCYLYLFAQGMTDVANSLYFGVDVVDEVLDYLSAKGGWDSYSVATDEYAFIDQYVEFLVRADLSEDRLRSLETGGE